jgi:hypothetical protein
VDSGARDGREQRGSLGPEVAADQSVQLYNLEQISRGREVGAYKSEARDQPVRLVMYTEGSRDCKTNEGERCGVGSYHRGGRWAWWCRSRLL